MALAVAAAATTFQLLHAAEHVLQALHWLSAPHGPAWLSPWAARGAGTLAAGTTGVELLHLVGNGVFLAGLLALRRVGVPSLALSWATRIQAVHVLEHAAIVASWLVAGRVVALSSLFGVLDSGAAAVAFRIWLHLVLNLAATAAALVAWRPVLALRPAATARW